MTEKNLSATTEADLGYGQILAILLRRRFLFLGVLASVVAAAGVSTLLKPATYLSSMQLLVEPNYQGEKDAGESAFSGSEPSQTDYATQINLMRSYQFIKQAVETLQPEYPELTPREVQSSFTLTQVVEDDINTKIFGATYTTDDPVKAQKVLSTLQEIYQDYNLDQQIYD